MELEIKIQQEYERAIANVPMLDEVPCASGLSIHDILKAHFLIANHFYIAESGLGGIGVKDMGLLQSAVFRQGAAFAGITKWTHTFDVCATLLYGLIKNHPFYDANKRTAFLCILFQLHKSGYCPATEKRVFEDLTVNIADNNLLKFARFQDLSKKNSEKDPEIKFISWFLHKNTRQIDNKSYSITYKQLNTILNKLGYSLENPNKNKIDVIKHEKKRTFLFASEKNHSFRVGQIGFPRWTAQVSKSDLKAVREITKQSSKYGVDSGSFFHGQDTMQSLVAEYNEPLMRLAYR